MSLKDDIQALIGALSGPSPEIRVRAALGELGEPEAEVPLPKLFDSDRPSFRATADAAIRKIKLALRPPGSEESGQ